MRHVLCVFLYQQDFYIGDDKVKPIPKTILIHRAVLHEKIKDSWDTKSPKKVGELERIRIEPSNKVIRDKNNEELQLAALLFFDCKNSSPRGQNFEVNQMVDFQGEFFRVAVVEPLYDRKKLHHYEIGMVRYVSKS